MKVGDLRVGGFYAWQFHGMAVRCICIDPRPAWANRSLGPGTGNGLFGSLEALRERWPDDVVDRLLVVEPFDKGRHDQKRGWPCFAVPYATYDRMQKPVKGEQPRAVIRWVPRAIYPGFIGGTWDRHLEEMAEKRRVAEEAERYAQEHAAEIAAGQARERAERNRQAAERKREQRRRDRDGAIVTATLAALGIEVEHHGRWHSPYVLVSLDDMMALLGRFAPEELALAVLADGVNG